MKYEVPLKSLSTEWNKTLSNEDGKIGIYQLNTAGKYQHFPWYLHESHLHQQQALWKSVSLLAYSMCI